MICSLDFRYSRDALLNACGRLIGKGAVWPYLMRAHFYFWNGEHDRAIEDFSAFIQQYPNIDKGFNERGLSYAKKGEYDRAIADYTEAIRLNREPFGPYINRGSAYEKKGELDKALADFREALSLRSHNAAAFADEESCIWQDSLFSMRGAEMDLPKSGDATSRFLAFVEGLTSVIGRADRAKPLWDYCIGLMMPGERKSVEPMAAITAPERTAAQHQSLLHLVGEGTWSDEKVLAKVREMVLPEIERHGPIEAWIIDDTGFPKKGRHSVGVGRQYCGELGKQDNCQIAVTLSIANHHASLPAAYRLYLPKEWATDRTRRRKAGVPKEITFKTKPAIALEQLRWACVAGLPRGVVLMDAGYGAHTDLRTNITALGLS